jgi:rubrerythrin
MNAGIISIVIRQPTHKSKRNEALLQDRVKKMGYSKEFHCDHCGYKRMILYESGMSFPQTYQKVLSAVKSGEYGDEMKNTAVTTKGIAIDAEWDLFICSNCGTWKNDYGLTLYEPDDDTAYAEKDYVTPYEIQINYHMKKPYFHKCPTCGKRMHRFKQGDQPICPICHQVGHIDPLGIWD